MKRHGNQRDKNHGEVVEYLEKHGICVKNLSGNG